MKHVMPFVGAGVMLTIAAVAGVASSAGAPREARGAAFVRPAFLPPRPSPQVDLTRLSNRIDADTLKRLVEEPDVCHEALDAAGVGFAVIEPAHTEQGCGYEDALTVRASLSDWSARDPLVMTCAMAARLHQWERHVVAPAVAEHFGVDLVEIEVLGAFSCRRVAGQDRLSNHAFGEAADIAGFRLSDGRTITVEDDYYSDGPKGNFLRQVRSEACELFDVTLGPDYNSDHRDHFHLDVGGERACR